ncbi:hypothetical protein Pcinc_032645 [Petrolisthes cinctipes]|uniref:Uncharacterized protein n=1 Tax=Petrolisthes cinctipes TaxID=88211 RepID=A0AAE1ETY6_PETCI|nr:hypothetical protein Pcinc_032645 [Petrolisthes cinctipes]
MRVRAVYTEPRLTQLTTEARISALSQPITHTTTLTSRPLPFVLYLSSFCSLPFIPCQPPFHPLPLFPFFATPPSSFYLFSSFCPSSFRSLPLNLNLSFVLCQSSSASATLPSALSNSLCHSFPVRHTPILFYSSHQLSTEI